MLCDFVELKDGLALCPNCGQVVEARDPTVRVFAECRRRQSIAQNGSPSPVVSIVMPVWNSEKYVRQAIQSIFDQTFQDFELIIVNDGSTDGTAVIVNELADERPNVFTIHQPNGGTGAALNAGFKLARGEYQTWWSSDSWVEPNWLQEMKTALDNHDDVGLVYTDYACHRQDGGRQRTIRTPDFDLERLRNECYLGPSWLWRRAVKKQAGDFSLDLCEDYDMHLRMSEITPFRRVAKVLGHWRDHDENLTNTICRPQGFAPGLRVGARHNWKMCRGIKVAWIGPYVDSAAVGWFLARGLNELGGGRTAVRHILGNHRRLKQIDDLLIGRDDAEIRRVLDECDLIHCNGCLPDDRHSLLNVRPWLDHGKPMLLHLHGGHWPWMVDRIEGYRRDYGVRLISCTPGIAEMFPGAQWMPNLIPVSEAGELPDGGYYQPPERWPAVASPLRVMFHHNYTLGKGGDFINLMFKWLREEVGVRLDTSFRCGNPIPLRNHLNQKKRFDVCIDQITQGFIGMAGWESMSQGAVVIARLDEFAVRAYSNLGSGEPPPILNARWIDEVATFLTRLSRDADYVLELKRRGREWMLRHYTARQIAKLWIDLYSDVTGLKV